MLDVIQRPVSFAAVLGRVHAIGKETVSRFADQVDRDARFPRESLAALKSEQLLSAYVPAEYGGMGLTVTELSKICEVLSQYCASTAMIYAMHQIQVACIVHHALGSAFFRGYMRDLVREQYLLASATTELGVGGDVRTSICAVRVRDEQFTLEKQAPVISYGNDADAILVTCRRSEDAPPSDQVQVLVRKQDYTLKQISGWDTLGFRGTCSCGFVLTSAGRAEQILPVPYPEIHSRTMHPFAHIVWGSLWLGIAVDAMNRARSAVRAQARKNPSVPPVSGLRLAEADTVLFQMRGGLHATLAEYQALLDGVAEDSGSTYGFAIKVNSLKLASSALVVDIVGRAMIICGIAGYQNDSKLSLGRHLRDAYGAALMVNNDRIMGQSATMLIAQRES
jgi:acyl-CoA dehydrogenase